MSFTKNKTDSHSASASRGRLVIIKIGGNIIDNEMALSSFLMSFAAIKEKKILVHGGGKLATSLAGRLGIPQEMVDGRRITDAETLKIITMVYAGYINKNIVAQLQSHGCDAIGLSGADGNMIQAQKRVHPSIDYGFVGDISVVNTQLLQSLLNDGLCVVAAPVTHNGAGVLLNTNADTIAQEMARSLSHVYEVQLIYSFERKGVLLDVEDESTLIPELTPAYYAELLLKKLIYAGMIPKLDNAFAALRHGVKQVIIGNAEELDKLIEGKSGTSIIYE